MSLSGKGSQEAMAVVFNKEGGINIHLSLQDYRRHLPVVLLVQSE